MRRNTAVGDNAPKLLIISYIRVYGMHRRYRRRHVAFHDGQFPPRFAHGLTVRTATQALAIAAPIHCIVGTNDKLTPGYHNHYRRWGDISEDVSLETIADAEHYFVGTHPEEVAAIISAAVGTSVSQDALLFSVN